MLLCEGEIKKVNECEGGRLHYEMLQYTIV